MWIFTKNNDFILTRSKEKKLKRCLQSALTAFQIDTGYWKWYPSKASIIIPIMGASNALHLRSEKMRKKKKTIQKFIGKRNWCSITLNSYSQCREGNKRASNGIFFLFSFIVWLMCFSAEYNWCDRTRWIDFVTLSTHNIAAILGAQFHKYIRADR